MKIRQNSQKRARIEMIPLIDVVFLLLVFFIYAMLSMVVHRGIKVDLPSAKSATVDKRGYVSLTITEGGDIYVDELKTSLVDMELLLLQGKERDPHLRVFIRGDKRASYERVIQVLDVVRKVGLSKVSLETEFRESKEGTEVTNQ